MRLNVEGAFRPTKISPNKINCVQKIGRFPYYTRSVFHMNRKYIDLIGFNARKTDVFFLVFDKNKMMKYEINFYILYFTCFIFFFRCFIEFIPKMIFNGWALFSVHIVNERGKKNCFNEIRWSQEKGKKKICPPGIRY